MLYDSLRRLLFTLPPETAHDLSLKVMDGLLATSLNKVLFPAEPSKGVDLLGLHFSNRIGLAAGLDKNGDHVDSLGGLGFGFVEIGTITPKPQAGNPKPRLFRLSEAEAIINRMGFNNKGVEHLVAQVQGRQYGGVLGINIGKNLTTPVEDALSDYTTALRAVYPFADYITVNISSPNTPGLRALQHGELLKELLSGLKYQQMKLAFTTNRFVPLFVKIAPDVDDGELVDMARVIADEGIDGLIATNTTSSRIGVSGMANSDEQGGLSGRPVMDMSTEVLAGFRQELPEGMPIIAAGGVFSGADAKRKIEAGADLVQVYTGFIYRGPSLISQCVRATG